jgi:hypothetical protein
MNAESMVTLVFALPSAQATGTQATATASAANIARFITPAINTSLLSLSNPVARPTRRALRS